ncbi:hypothetical protein [Salinicola peritrichatus]|uniref:hypothetical protein n=1 Tax=Salinicola peritrichatus TaxID=1267424 RepID=UPI0013A60068|nr:hypothetical protein [Salinicola peritrichatus]
MSDPLATGRYGTATVEPALQPIALGELSFAWQAGALRWLRYGDVELVRGIAAVLRDPQWGTFTPLVDDERMVLSDNVATLIQAFHLPREGGGDPPLHGRLKVAATRRRIAVTLALEACAAFTTARSGLSVLLPLQGFAGAPVEVTHADGHCEAARLPRLISPSQPLFDIRRLRLAPAPGLEVQLDFEGDVFEMEDQRNWSDASFKIYNRPLAWPTPYVLEAGAEVTQTVTVSLIDPEESGHER